jgi:hypothetical protein
MLHTQELQEVQERCAAAAVEAAASEAATAAALQRKCEAIAAVYRLCSARGVRLGPSAFEEGHHHWGGENMPQVTVGESLLLYISFSSVTYINACMYR